MEKQLITLLKLGFDLDDFYVITIWDHEIKLQGRLNNDTLAKYIKLGYEFKSSEMGFTSLKNNLEIIFTV